MGNIDHRTALAPWIVVTGLDGSGKTTLVRHLGEWHRARCFRLPFHEFVKPGIARSGHGRPFADVLTDRLLFATDARLTNYLIAQWRQHESVLVSQRGWMDSFVFGAVQGVSWSETAAMLNPADLERPTAIVHLVADPEMAFERIRQDPHKDKYETLPFMRRQHAETLRFYHGVECGDPRLTPFVGIPSFLIDTTALTVEHVFETAQTFLGGILAEWSGARRADAAVLSTT